MRIRRSLVALIVLATLLAPLSVQAAPREPSGRADKTAPTCNLPESNAEALVILNNYYPGYWWDHTDLTVAVQAHPRATEEQLAAIHDAIETWSDVLLDCFDGLITLTDVTGTGKNPQKAASADAEAWESLLRGLFLSNELVYVN